MGVRHFCMGWDMSILHDWFTETGKAMRDVLAGALDARTPGTHTLRTASE